MMSEAKYIELVESVIDFANAVESACVNLRRQIEGKQKLGQPAASKWILVRFNGLNLKGLKGLLRRVKISII